MHVRRQQAEQPFDGAVGKEDDIVDHTQRRDELGTVARALDGAASIPEALQVYQRARIDRTARVVTESTEHGGLYHIVDPEEMRRAFEKKNLAKERAEWLFSYDPLTVPLN